MGSTGRATGENLAGACQSIRRAAHNCLSQIDAVIPCFDYAREYANAAVDLRLRACQRIAVGWRIEREAS